MDVLKRRLRAVLGLGETVNANGPIIEHDVILQQRAGVTQAIDTVVKLVSASVVVDDGAIYLGVRRFRPDQDPARARVMNDDVDELGPRPSVVDTKGVAHVWSWMHDLETPIPRI